VTKYSRGGGNEKKKKVKLLRTDCQKPRERLPFHSQAKEEVIDSKERERFLSRMPLVCAPAFCETGGFGVGSLEGGGVR